jgi:MarR family transcriptional regulator, negative regulator of the multidrug operon emrRAB
MAPAKNLTTANRIGALALALVDLMQASVASPDGLDAIDATALNAIGHRPGCSIRELASVLALTHPGAVRCVDRLATAGLIARRAGPDARTAALHLTARGKSTWTALRDARLAALATLVDDLPARERAAAEGLANALLPALCPSAEASERICRLCAEHVCVPAGCPITAPTSVAEAGR